MKKLEKILKNNFEGNKNELFVTLTTANDVTDIELIKKYFKSFIYRLKKYNNNIEYVYVIEKNSNRNSWHIHAMLKDTKRKNLYISNEIIEGLWRMGQTKTSRISNRCVEKEIDEDNDIKNKKVDNEYGIDRVISYMTKIRTKEAIKIGTKSYFKSRGIKIPRVEKAVYSDVEKRMNNNYYLKNENTLLLKDKSTGKIIGKIKKESWRRIKGKKK